MIDLKLLRSFIAVAEELSFRKAAARIGITQPPLSRHIKNLEESLGVDLMLRDKHHVSLTPAGGALLDKAYQLLSHAQDVSTHVRNRQLTEGRVTVGYVPSAALQILPCLLPRFSSANPDIQLTLHDMSVDEQLSALLNERIDVGLSWLPVQHPLLASEIIVKDHFMVALSSNSELSNKKNIHPNDLNGMPLVLFPVRSFGAGLHFPISSFLNDFGIRPPTVLNVNSFQSAIGLAASGVAVAIVPQSMKVLQHPKVIFRDFSEGAPAAELGMVWRLRNPWSPAREEFIASARALSLISLS